MSPSHRASPRTDPGMRAGTVLARLHPHHQPPTELLSIVADEPESEHVPSGVTFWIAQLAAFGFLTVGAVALWWAARDYVPFQIAAGSAAAAFLIIAGLCVAEYLHQEKP